MTEQMTLTNVEVLVFYRQSGALVKLCVKQGTC
jgi:hypothetical protein